MRERGPDIGPATGADRASIKADPIVSVVIPHFNRPNELACAIRTVEAQVFTNWEIIVVDDCSPVDPTSFILATFRNRRIRVLRLEKNSGPSVARNIGMAAARGRFVAFLDSDDEWMPEKLQRQISTVMSLSNPDAAFCLGKATVTDSAGEIAALPKRPLRRGENPSEYIYLWDGFVQTSCVFVGRERAAAVGFRPELRRYEDHIFFIECINSGMVYVFVDQELSLWKNDAREDWPAPVG